MPKKKVLRILRNYAGLLPSNSVLTYTDSKISGADLLLCGQTQVDGIKIDPEKDYILKVPTYVEQNNYKELKKVLVSKGANGVINRVKA